MRLIFCNPQTVIGKTLFSTIFRFNHSSKYDFLFSLFNKPYNAVILVDGTVTSLTYGSARYGFLFNNYVLMRIISFFEIFIWCLINKINPFKVKIIFSTKLLNIKSDILFGFAFLSDFFIREKLIRVNAFSRFKGKRILHFSHYYSKPGGINEQLRKLHINTIIAESNLKYSRYFCEYFNFIKNIIVLPHVLKEKYRSHKPFFERKNKAVTYGIITTIDRGHPSHKRLFDFFKSSSLHPMRKILYDKRKEFINEVDVKIFEDPGQKTEEGIPNIISKIKRVIRAPQKSAYHKINIVNDYNQYRIVVVPEESTGVPGIGFIEAMACGCAFIGIRDQMYSDLGLVEGFHFIAYDGSLTDLKNTIQYYQLHEKKLEQIASCGKEFVMKRFNEKFVLESFWKKLKSL